MPSREELLKEAESIREQHNAANSANERARLEARYREIDRKLGKLNTSGPSFADIVASRTIPSSPSVLDGFPRKEPKVHIRPRGEWLGYILPVLLLTLVAIVMALVYIPTLSQRKDLNLAVPTDKAPAEDRIKNANTLVENGDKAWEKGYKWWNSESDLQDARNLYKQAWRELTGSDWSGQKDASKPIVDSADARTLREKLVYRIPELEKTLNGWSPLR